MIDTPSITQTVEQQAAIIRFTIPREQIQQVMGPGFQELATVLAAQGIAPTGPYFSHHLRMDPAVFDFELGVPVSRSVAASGRVRPGGLPAGRAVHTTYRGGYEGLGDAWGQFCQWIGAQGLATGADLWECYAAGPESSPDPAQWRTELYVPLQAV